MIETNHQASTVEKAVGWSDSGVGKSAEFLVLKNKRVIEVHKNLNRCVGWSQDPGISVEIARDERRALNEAQILLLPEEVQAFTQALIQHPILLPTSYSQNLSKARGMYCLRIASQEPFSDFAERLSEALGVLGQ